jgi:very-short-patch-repair endonuclease
MISEKPDYETTIASMFMQLGYQVVDAKDYLGDMISSNWVIVRQYNPRIQNEKSTIYKFRCDFAHPPTKCALEFDGYGLGHTGWVSFHKDRARDRIFLLADWRTMRIGPKDCATLGGVYNMTEMFIKLIRNQLSKK